MARHVAILTDSFPPDIRSSAILMHAMAEGLQSRGYDVTVLTVTRGGPVAVRAGGIRVLRVPMPGLPLHGVSAVRKGVAWLALPISTTLRAFTAMRRPDAVWVYSPPLTLGLAAAAIRAVHRCRVILNVQDLFPDNAVDLGLLRGPLEIAFFQQIEDFCYRNADRIVVHSDAHVARLAEHPALAARRPDIRVIPNFVDVDAVGSAAPDPELKQRLGLSGRFVFVFGGVMGFAQDLDLIVEAARRLRERKDIGFLLVGDGVRRATAQRMAGPLDNLRFHDPVPPAVYHSWLRSADAGLVTLRAETATPVVPSKTLTYMAAGLPVVAAIPRASDAVPLLSAARGGVWVPAGDAAALAAACAAVASDPASARAMGRRAREFCIAHFSAPRVLDRIVQLLDEVVGIPHGRDGHP